MAHDLVETAAAAGSFTTLVAAVREAGLEPSLRGGGPFTVFAPTDEAFARLPKAELDRLLGDHGRLLTLLTHHMVVGELAAADVAASAELVTVAGEPLDVRNGDGVSVGGATVVEADVRAANGIIHAIDAVLTPAGKAVTR